MGKGREAVPINSFGGPDMMGTLRFAHPTVYLNKLIIKAKIILSSGF